MLQGISGSSVLPTADLTSGYGESSSNNKLKSAFSSWWSTVRSTFMKAARRCRETYREWDGLCRCLDHRNRRHEYSQLYKGISWVRIHKWAALTVDRLCLLDVVFLVAERVALIGFVTVNNVFLHSLEDEGTRQPGEVWTWSNHLLKRKCHSVKGPPGR